MDAEREQDTGLKNSGDTIDKSTPSNSSESDSRVENVKDKELKNHSIISSDLESIDLNDTSTENLSSTVTDSPTSVHSNTQSGKKKRTLLNFLKSPDTHSTTMVAETSTTGLILEGRPSDLPAKSDAEIKKHQKMYDAMVSQARKKELKVAKQKIKEEQSRRKKDDITSAQLHRWSTEILPHWETMKDSKKVQDLWWQGLPPGVRGQVWIKAIGNELNLSRELYEISLRRCNSKLSDDSRPRSDSTSSINKENSIEVIHLDVLRTFPTLCFFQEGGPLHKVLHDVLGAYVCYRPDVGYVQGMSFLAAVLLLNMEGSDAFICLANLLNRSCYNVFFRVDYQLMRPYFAMFDSFLSELLPRVYDHFHSLEFNPEYYLIEWIFTLYTRTLPLDVACRVWDMFCRDGESFLFRTALGIIRMHQTELLLLHSIEEIGQYLGHLPTDLSSAQMFAHITSVHLSDKKFNQALVQFSSLKDS